VSLIQQQGPKVMHRREQGEYNGNRGGVEWQKKHIDEGSGACSRGEMVFGSVIIRHRKPLWAGIAVS